jgi:hypothetical protein
LFRRLQTNCTSPKGLSSAPGQGSSEYRSSSGLVRQDGHTFTQRNPQHTKNRTGVVGSSHLRLESTSGKYLDIFRNGIDELLQVLHQAPPLLHRDIRWPNIIRRLDNPQEWFLVDWEEAAGLPTKAPLHFSKEDHSPRIFSDGHGAEVDIWGV